MLDPLLFYIELPYRPTICNAITSIVTVQKKWREIPYFFKENYLNYSNAVHPRRIIQI